MDYTAYMIGPFPLHDIQSIFCGITAVYNDWEIGFLCQIHLPHEPFLLYFMVFFIPIIIQTNFPYCNGLLFVTQISQPFHFLFGQISHFIRMHTYGSIHKRIDFHKLYRICHTSETCSYINDPMDSVFIHRTQQLISVFIKSIIIIMCMSFKYHEFFSPSIVCI